MISSRLAAFVLVLTLMVGCSPTMPSADSTASDSAQSAPTTLTVATHDSFTISEDLIASFEEDHNVRVQFLALGDAGEALNKMILSKDAPLADVFFGVDNTFLSRALDADLFLPYESPQLAHIPTALILDAESRLLPVDVGYVTLNADREWFAANDVPLPTSLADLTAPAYRGLLVVQNPATSSPGLAFLLATVGFLGQEQYLDFWQELRANDVLVTSGWSEAYYEHFTVGSGGEGDRPLVVSYSTSPPADVLFATDGRTEPASVNVNLAGGTFRQIEFVGIVRGTQQGQLAQAFVDFLLGEQVQEDIPLQMFVYPANQDAALPVLFDQFAEIPADTVEVEPAAIEENREQWLQAWTDVMLR